MDIAYLIPINKNAVQQLCDAYLYMQQQHTVADDTLKILQKVTLTATVRPVGNDGDASATAPSSSEDFEDFGYLLSLDENRLPSNFGKGWIVGCGSITTNKVGPSEVDILIANPKISGTIAPAHASFRFHSESGSLLVSPCSQEYSVEIHGEWGWESVRFGHSRAIVEPFTRIRLGKRSQYGLQLIRRSSSDSLKFFDRLADVCAYRSDQKLDLSVDFLPSAMTRTFHSAQVCLNSGALASGAFGRVYTGFSFAGVPLAIKTFDLKYVRDYRAVLREFNFAQQFRKAEHVVSSLKFWCEHDEDASKDLCSACREKNKALKPFSLFLSSRLAVGTFYDFLPARGLGESDGDIPFSFQEKLSLFHQAFIGMGEIQAMGLIHRDITLRNLLIVSLNPLKAAITDFGKATKHRPGSPEFKTQLGPLPYVAPEVWSGQGYGQSIDLYSLALSLASLFLPLPPPWVGAAEGGEGTRVSAEMLDSYRSELAALGKRQTSTKPLLELLCSILRWDPQDRVSLTAALSHECWREVESYTTEKVSDKRQRGDAERTDPNAGDLHERAERDRGPDRQPTQSASASTEQTITPTEPFSSGFYDVFGENGEFHEPSLEPTQPFTPSVDSP